MISIAQVSANTCRRFEESTNTTPPSVEAFLAEAQIYISAMAIPAIAAANAFVGTQGAGCKPSSHRGWRAKDQLLCNNAQVDTNGNQVQQVQQHGDAMDHSSIISSCKTCTYRNKRKCRRLLHLILSFVKVLPILNPQDLVSIVAREGCKVSGVWCYKQAAELLLHVCATVQQRRICTARFLVEFDLKATGVCVMRTRLKPWWWS